MKTKLNSNKTSLFKTHTSHSPEEILASGGAESAEPFTSEEWEKLMAQLDATK
ncbi:hypothetical protein ACFP1I_24640 [Dyadobacter subterraneus]|uniref:Uncharacterized protein n=1 Tax=Dyadobacter subterraneus TaxID=2773304 RepID=A0ABR9WLI0_9BACT|nr:hypothetical protein [Dyadobacter subterraneus]MBE9466365.1 hypothetical protein [Dyadobacter subterraneus]